MLSLSPTPGTADGEVPGEEREGVRNAADAAEYAEPNPRRLESKEVTDPDDGVGRDCRSASWCSWATVDPACVV